MRPFERKLWIHTDACSKTSESLLALSFCLLPMHVNHCFVINQVWRLYTGHSDGEIVNGTFGIQTDKKGLATLPQGNQEPLVVGRPPSWALGGKSVELTFFPSMTVSVGLQERHSTCKKLGVGMLVVTIWLEFCMSYSSGCHHSPPPSSLAPIKSRMETFWYRLAGVILENGRKRVLLSYE